MPRLRRIITLSALSVIATFSSVAQARPAGLSDLPITEIRSGTGQTLAIFWSGDGGWAALVGNVSKALAANGVAVIGINSRAWLEGGKRTPEDLARDTERILRAYLTQWSRSKVILLGYSRGAGFMPFIVNRLPADLRQRVVLVGLLGAEPAASFEFHMLDLVRDTKRPSDRPVLPEILRSGDTRYFCLYGSEEKNTICPQMDSARTTIVARNGDHHFDRDYAAIAQDILRALPTK
jgi:peptidoglycan-N-acetylglucosamine deacetylase